MWNVLKRLFGFKSEVKDTSKIDLYIKSATTDYKYRTRRSKFGKTKTIVNITMTCVYTMPTGLKHHHGILLDERVFAADEAIDLSNFTRGWRKKSVTKEHRDKLDASFKEYLSGTPLSEKEKADLFENIVNEFEIFGDK